jgi:hypothetical protein
MATKMRVLNCLMGWQLKCDSYKLFYGLATKMILVASPLTSL